MSESFKAETRAEVMQNINALQDEHDRKEEQVASKNTASNSQDNKHKDIVLNNLMCPLTLAVFIDPVLAADGFAHERSAIIKSLEKNDRSPMTNQVLPNKDLNPDHIIKQIISALQMTKS